MRCCAYELYWVQAGKRRFMKSIHLFIAVGVVSLSSGCRTACPAVKAENPAAAAERTAADAEARRYHCRKCTCEKFRISDPTKLLTSLCVGCGHDAKAHEIPGS